MTDIATISAFLSSIKTATEIAKAIKDADISIEKAESKLKMAELISSLADAKIHAAEIQGLLQEKNKKITELENAFEIKSKLIRHEEAYYEVDDNGAPIGDPYCSHCWEVNHKAVHLHYGLLRRHRICPACKNAYD